ncbi:hypothetical protein CAL7716_102980 (plasmid) [Calothrix sp. PCC 7716]|nr:hypothetical protein CAL7716_102980 [Calothrix sp. PCC 7716]
MSKVRQKKPTKLRLDNVSVKFWTTLFTSDALAGLLYLQPLPKNFQSPKNKTVNGVIVNVEGAVAEDFRKADQKYFQQHPQEKVYVRSPFPNEFQETVQPRKVEVRQIEAGTRIRMPIW